MRKYIITIIISLFTYNLNAFVSWDGYYLTIENDIVKLKQNNEVIAIVHISKLSILKNRMIIEAGSEKLEIEISDANKRGIEREIDKNGESKKPIIQVQQTKESDK